MKTIRMLQIIGPAFAMAISGLAREKVGKPCFWGATNPARTLSPLVDGIQRSFARSRRIPAVSAAGDRRSSEGYSPKWQEFSVPRFWAPHYFSSRQRRP